VPIADVKYLMATTASYPRKLFPPLLLKHCCNRFGTEEIKLSILSTGIALNSSHQAVLVASFVVGNGLRLQIA
jgi:hypothetical protein